MKRWILHGLGALWCLVWAIPVWLIYILPLWLIFKDFKFVGFDGPFIASFTLALADPTIEPFHVKLWSGWYGVGLPCAYIYRDEPTPNDDLYVQITRAHERRHVHQWFVFGPLFPIAYWIGMIYSKTTTGEWYKFNPFETDAIIAGLRKHGKSNV